MKQILLFSLLIPMTCFGRLGETLEQLDARYGIRTDKTPNSVCYLKEGFNFYFELADNKAVMMAIEKENEETLLNDEIKVFLQRNSKGSGFVLVPTEHLLQKSFLEPDSGRKAIYKDEQRTLFIYTPEGLLLSEKRRKTELQNKTSGF